jgi:hypothetical protein
MFWAMMACRLLNLFVSVALGACLTGDYSALVGSVSVLVRGNDSGFSTYDSLTNKQKMFSELFDS